jgi:hypothetical protein
MSHKFPVHQFSGRDKNNPYARVEVRKYFYITYKCRVIVRCFTKDDLFEKTAKRHQSPQTIKKLSLGRVVVFQQFWKRDKACN